MSLDVRINKRKVAEERVCFENQNETLRQWTDISWHFKLEQTSRISILADQDLQESVIQHFHIPLSRKIFLAVVPRHPMICRITLCIRLSKSKTQCKCSFHELKSLILQKYNLYNVIAVFIQITLN